MSEKSSRRPIANFMIKRSLQTGIILQIVLIMVFTSVLTAGILALFYNTKSAAGSFYYMSNDVMQDLELTNILGIVLPAVIVAQAVGLAIAFAIGLFSSRKVAVPVYKIEKWASTLRQGDLRTRLMFREREQKMTEDLTRECNGVVEFYSGLFSEIRAALQGMESEVGNQAVVRKHMDAIRQTLAKVRFE